MGDMADLALTPSVPHTIYAGSWFAGIHKSRDRGGTWEAARRGLPKDTSVFSLVLDPYDDRTVYAGTQDILNPQFTGVFKSTDAGSNWAPVNQGIDPSAGEISAMGATPWNGGAILAGGLYGIYRTTNKGIRWQKAGVTGYVDPFVQSFATDPAHPRYVYAACSQGILRSSDGGETWAPSARGINYPTICLDIAVDPQTPSTLYVTQSAPGGVWRSADRGETWTMIRAYEGCGDYDSVAVDPSGTVYVGVNWCGILKTTDSGATWTLLTDGLPHGDRLYPLYMDLVVDPRSPSTIYAATTMGVYRSDDAGSTWADINQGLTAVEIEEVVLDRQTPGLIYARAGPTDDLVISRSMDGGTTWEKIYPGPSGYGPARPEAYRMATGGPRSGVVYFAGHTFDQVLYRSTDAGQNWKRIFARGTGASYPSFLVSHPAAPRTVYYGLTGEYEEYLTGVFRSEDGGDSWVRAARLPRDDISPACIALHPTDRRVIYVGGYSGVYGSKSSGDTWTDLTGNLPQDPYITALVVDPSNIKVMYAGTRGRGVFRTADGGGSWTQVNSGLRGWKAITALAIDPSDTSILYAGTWESGLYKTRDAGQTWKSINTGIFSPRPRSIVIDPADPLHVYVGCFGSGIYETTTGGE